MNDRQVREAPVAAFAGDCAPCIADREPVGRELKTLTRLDEAVAEVRCRRSATAKRVDHRLQLADADSAGLLLPRPPSSAASVGARPKRPQESPRQSDVAVATWRGINHGINRLRQHLHSIPEPCCGHLPRARLGRCSTACIGTPDMAACLTPRFLPGGRFKASAWPVLSSSQEAAPFPPTDLRRPESVAVHVESTGRGQRSSRVRLPPGT